MFKKILILTLFAATAAHATPQRLGRDIKLPTQKLIEEAAYSVPAATSTTAVLSGYAGAVANDSVTLTSGITDPDVARVITMTTGGTTGDIEAGTVTIVGHNALGAQITDTFTFPANFNGSKTGTKAFAEITSITFSEGIESGSFAATWSVGYNDSLGLHRCMDADGHVLFATYGGTKEGTAPTMHADVDEVEKNWADLNTALAGSDVEVFFVQNYRCYP